MKKITLILAFMALGFIFVMCNGKSKHKEAAKEFLDQQMQSKPEQSTATTDLMTFDHKVKVISDNTFDQFTGKGLTVLDFWATWCVPCRKQAPVFEKLATEMGDQVRFGKMDIDQNKQSAENFEILTIPAIMIFKDGKMVEHIEGLKTKEFLKSAISKYL